MALNAALKSKILPEGGTRTIGASQHHINEISPYKFLISLFHAGNFCTNKIQVNLNISKENGETNS
jgi:hypothetical protein